MHSQCKEILKWNRHFEVTVLHEIRSLTLQSRRAFMNAGDLLDEDI